MSTKTANVVRINRRNGNGQAEASSEVQPVPVTGNTVEDIKSRVTAQLEAAYKEAMAMRQKDQAEIAEPAGPFAWDVLAFGPIELGAQVFPFGGPPYFPNQIIRVGDTAVVVTVLVFGPLFTDVITKFRAPYEISYSTGDLKNWRPAGAELQGVNTGSLIPNLPFVVDVFEFTPQTASLYEMNICAQILDCEEGTAPPFAGYARRTTKIEPVIFLPEQNVLFDTGIKFQVYENED